MLGPERAAGGIDGPQRDLRRVVITAVDPLALESTMTRLDAEEAEARTATKSVDHQAALDYLADLPRLWQETAPERHRNLADAMFERIEVLGTS